MLIISANMHDFPSYVWCSSVVVWCYGVRLSCVGFWCEATLFSALRSSDFCPNIRRDESPFSSRALWMKLCLAVEQQRLKGPGPVVGLFVYCVLRYAMKYNTYQPRQQSDCVRIILRGMANWHFLIVSEAACKWLETQQNRNIQTCWCGLNVGILAKYWVT